MAPFNMHTIKRAAHREAWYGDSMNPFRKGGGSKTWDVTAKSKDVEAGAPSSPLSHIATEPTPTPNRNPFPSPDTVVSPNLNGGLGEEKPQMTNALGNGARQAQDSEETAVERPTGRPPSEEHIARRRFLSRFRREKGDPEISRTATEKSTGKSSKRSLKHKKFTVGNQLRATIFNSWVNILLLAAPVGMALHFVDAAPVAVFVVNFIAIIPLAALLSFGTEEIALRVGETLGGLLNASFGNAVELIVSIIALVKGEYVVVKTSLIGSILSNLLLVMGMCFFFGGLRRHEQFFNITVAQTATGLLALAIASVIIPTVFANWVPFPSTTTEQDKLNLTAQISRGTAIILLFVYGCYLYFQLSSHAFMYQQESQKVAMRPMKHHLPEGGIKKAFALGGGVAAAQGRTHPLDMDIPPDDEIMRKDALEQQKQSDDDDEDEPQLHIWVAIFTLAASTVIVAICAEFLVSSINAITGPNSKVSVEFVGLILLPIVGNAAEHATAVTVAVKDKMDLAIGVAVGSSMQIALLVLPLSIILGWILGHDEMNLSFDGFQVAVLFVSVLLVNYATADGRSNYLEGILLQCLYIIIAVTAWFYPQNPEATS